MTEEPYLADPTGEKDSTMAIQTAIDSASFIYGGSTVFLPAGQYKINKNLIIRKQVTLRGEYKDPDKVTDGDYGTVVMADVKSSERYSPALLKIEINAGIQGITVYYPNQNVEKPLPYGYTFEIENNSDITTLKNCTVLNGYRGFNCVADDPLTDNVESDATHGLITILGFKGTFLKNALVSENAADVDVYNDMHFSPEYWTNATSKYNAPSRSNIISAMNLLDSVGILAAALEWVDFKNITINGYKTAIHIME